MSKLVRVLKNIKRRLPDGTIKTYRQAFLVKKAAPGDIYAQGDKKNSIAKLSNSYDKNTDDIDAGSDLDNSSGAPDVLDPNAQVPTDHVFDSRMGIQPLILPWLEPLDIDHPDATDPVPYEIRQKFSNKKIKAYYDPAVRSTPISSVQPGDELLYNTIEYELVYRLRTGIVTSLKASSTSSGTFVAKITSTDGIVDRAYVRFDRLMDESVYDAYGEIYDIEKENGSLSRRAAASYELAKAAGFDDIVPPTVYRYDEHDGLEPILSVSAIEDLAAIAGLEKNDLKHRLGKSAAFELWLDESSLIYQQDWFSEMNSNGGDGLNNIYERIPDSAFLIRGAIFDYLAWTGNRTWMDVVFSEDPRHEARLVNNGLTFPDPRKLGAAYLDYQSAYTEQSPANLQYMPLLWSDLVSTCALRGYEKSAEIYDLAAIACAERMTGQNVLQLIRTLMDHGLPILFIAGMLIRMAFLRYGAHFIMRNPLEVIKYYSSVLTGEDYTPPFDMNISAIEESVNHSINRISFANFDWRKAMMSNNGEDANDWR